MTKQAVVKLPRVGWFGSERPYKHKVPKAPRIELEDIVIPITRTEGQPFKTYLVESLASIRDNDGRSYGMCNLTDALEWLEGNGYIEPVKFVQPEPFYGNVHYQLTDLGAAFLKAHEAPEAWL